MLEIRRATINDATHIALLGRITYTQSHGNYIENKLDLLNFYEKNYSVTQIRKELLDENNLFWLVFSDELPIGFAKLCLNINQLNLRDPNSCKLQRLYILNDFIALKIGSRMQEIILQNAISLNFKKIWLTVYHKNTKGIKFYKKYDFKEIGSIDFYVGNTNYENLIFSKKLKTMQEYSKSKLNRIKRGQNRATYDVEKIKDILDAGFIGYVSYNFQGKAIAIPMAYGRDGNKIILHGSNANRMLTTLLEAKEMSMTVMHLDALVLARSGFHHSVNYRSATLFGSVQKIEEPTKKDAALKCFMEHMMKGRWDGIREMTKEEFDRTLVVEMTIETASAKIRDVGVNDEPEDYNLNVWAGLVPIKQIAEYPIPDEGIPQKMEIPKHVLDYYHTNKK